MPADESNQDIHQISFPRYEDIKAECHDAKYQYLFTLDDTAFFRVALSHADKMHILEVTGGKFINRHYMRSAAPKGVRACRDNGDFIWMAGMIRTISAADAPTGW